MKGEDFGTPELLNSMFKFQNNAGKITGIAVCVIFKMRILIHLLPGAEFF